MSRPRASERIAWAVERLAVRPEDRILEIGCGHGVAVSEICERLEGGNVLAIDRSAKMIAAATRRSAEHVAAGRATFATTTFEAADFGAQRFEKVLAIHVGLFTRRHPALALSRVGDLLAPDGRIHLAYQPLDPAGAEATAAAFAATLVQNGFADPSVTVESLAAGTQVHVSAGPTDGLHLTAGAKSPALD